jgi:hypothetical protein
MIGPLLSLFTSPHRFYSTIVRDEQLRKLWIEDLKYFRACDFFDCSKPPDFGKLSAFSGQHGVRVIEGGMIAPGTAE